jgi:hypothetical protein
MVHAGLRGHIHLGEFDGKVLGAELGRGGLSALAVASSHQDENSFGGELSGNFPSDSLVGSRHKCNRIGHNALGAQCG